MNHLGTHKSGMTSLTIYTFLVYSIVYTSPLNAEKHSEKQLNDTGITWSGNSPTGNNQDCTNAVEDKSRDEQAGIKENILNTQDCAHGRDVNFSDDKDGLAGFVYKKIGQSGQELPATAKEWYCVLDTVSGLMWESKNKSDEIIGNNGLADSDDQFTWYSSQSNNNAGKIGNWNNSGQDCAGYIERKPTTYCHTEQFVSRVNKQGLCGYTDWKIPTRTQLTSLVNFGRTEPAVDPRYFPNTHNGFYWSASPVVNRVTDAWAQNFQFGFVSPMRRTDKLYIRLVRESK